MIRIRRPLKILQVACHASRVGQVVIVVDVTINALSRRHGVHAGQSESRGRVIELTIRPLHRVMTLLAGRRESRMRHWRGRVVVVGLMATHARRAGQVVVVIDVAIRTLPRWDRVRTRQRES